MINNTTKQILSLDQKSTKELNEMYVKLYCEKPNVRSKSHLIRKIAYRLQELEYGFLPDKYVKKLEKLTDEFEKGKCFVTKKFFKPTHGTKIKRIYNGVNYEVEATDTGFIFEGQQYRSLSAIARKITGTRWNGLRFFGVKK
jgi:hypothetical protein